jgi:membrane-bound lytic murein transglycosylase B
VKRAIQMNIYKKLVLIGLILSVIHTPGFRNGSVQADKSFYLSTTLKHYDYLFSYLEEAQIPLTEVQDLFLDPRAEFYDDIAINWLQPPSMNNYSSISFQSADKYYEIEDFLQTYKKDLKQAEKLYKVEKETITAILLIETRLGKIIGKHSVFNILSSLAMADQPPSLEIIKNYINANFNYLDHNSRQKLIIDYQERAIRKAEMARAEFVSLIKLWQQDQLDILEIPGSRAGAFGYPQFMPSSLLRYGIDGDKDGKVDLYNYHDAIMSIANYLRAKGWGKEIDSQYKALLRYNYSQTYANNVIATANSIKNELIF